MKAKLINILEPSDGKIGDIVVFEMGGFHFVAELKDCSSRDFPFNKEIDIDIKFYCHEIIGVYKSEEEFHKDVKSMNTESMIPVGSFPPNDDDMDNFRPSPMNFINSVVDEIVDNNLLGAPDNFIFFEGKMMGLMLDQCLTFVIWVAI